MRISYIIIFLLLCTSSLAGVDWVRPYNITVIQNQTINNGADVWDNSFNITLLNWYSQFADTTRTVTDYDNPVIEKTDIGNEITYPNTKIITINGLDMETRISQMEKMIWELKQEVELLKK